MVNVIIYILLALHVLCSILLTFLVLMQRPKSEGLGAAFGGGVTESIFGAGTSEVLTKMTIWLGSFFIGVTLTLAILYAHRSSASSHMQQKLLTVPAAEKSPVLPATSEKTTTQPVAPAASTEAPATAPAASTETPAPAAPSAPEQKK